MPSLLTFILLWGVWLLTPVFVDGFDAIGRLIAVRMSRKVGHEPPVDDADLPTLAVIVPAHNEAEVIDRCLMSVKAQDYPPERLEVIVVDDGSTDETADIAESHLQDGRHDELVIRGQAIMVGPFRGRFLVIRNERSGKSGALNAGIAASTADIIVNIDSDVVLAPGSVRAIAEAFVRDEAMGAATGNIEVDWEMSHLRDAQGAIVIGEDGLPVPRRLSRMERFLAHSQFLEYLASFRLARHAQSLSGSMYTLAGACSAFRRSAIEAVEGYSPRTVSEDTDMTWLLHEAGIRIGFIPRARVLLDPVLSWDELYGQRVRWARGQLEVSALNYAETSRADLRISRLTLPKMLLFDHTLAFPRLVWTPLVLFFPILGYPPKLIAIAIVAMYVFYLGIEAVNALACFSVAEEDTRERMEHCATALLGLPAYRFIVFHFRFSGFLVTLREEQRWTVPSDFDRTRRRLELARLRSVRLATLLLRVSLGRMLAFAAALATPALAGVAASVRYISEYVSGRNG